jgi:catechol 2,3-dioxygenase-like lactoylglutathione lyase family enzyme
MPNLSVAIVSVPVRDQTRARDFYRDKLGFTLVMESAMGDDVTWFETMPAGSLRGLVLETNDIAAEHSRLRAADVDIDDIKDASWGRFAILRDIDGNGLVLTSHAGR